MWKGWQMMERAVSDAPSPFSTIKPKLQVVWDSVSLKALQFCPRHYQHSIIEGYRTTATAVDLEFGIFFASAVEKYKKERLNGKSKEEAGLLALQQVTEQSWVTSGMAGPTGELEDGSPWGGAYVEQWRCTGANKYKNKAGNAAKCPWSHKGKWFFGDAPHHCGECGSETEVQTRWVPNDPNKNRHTLVRLLAGYVAEQPDSFDQGGLHPYKFPDGTPAVELSFKFPLPFKAGTGEPFILAGHLDSIMEVSDGSERFISDNKSTKATLTSAYWKQFEPNMQVNNYDLAGTLMFPDLGISGVVIEAAQTLVDSGRFASQLFRRNDAQREEHLRELEYWMGLAEKFVDDDYWPMNLTNCKLCPFQKICKLEPNLRQQFLKADYEVKRWNPLEER